MGEETHPSRIGNPISHGICHSCAERLWGEEGTQLQRFNGEVFDCWNADQPGGCGCTVKCSACMVRRTVLDTYDSGAGRARVPVTLKVRENGVGGK